MLPLPHRRAQRESGAAGGADRHHARRRRHPAAAAADRAESRAGDDRQRPARARRRRRRRSASSTRSSRAGDLRGAAIAFAKRIADKRPLPRVRDGSTAAEAQAEPGMFEPMRKAIARKARNQKAPYHCIAAVEAATHAALRRRVCATRAAAVRRAGELRRGAGAALRLLRRARGGEAARHPAEGHAAAARSGPRRWSAPAPWAAASP